MKTLLQNIIAFSFLFVGYVFITGSNHESNVPNIKPKHIKVSQIKVSQKLKPNFYDVLGFYESGNRYDAVNSIGYLGKYQFNIKTLKWIGINVNKTEFLNSPKLQEVAVRKYVIINKKLLKPYINKYANTYFTTVNGDCVFVTECGILGGAHLGGHNSVKKFFDSKGKINRKDGNGTSILDYIEIFSKTQI